MSSIKIELTQIEKSDLSDIRNLIGSSFKKFFPISEFAGWDFSKWIEWVQTKSAHHFAIRVHKSSGDSVGRNFLVGICGVSAIDFYARHGRLFFAMVDKDGHTQTLQNHPSSITAFKKLLEHCFLSLNLNRVYISYLDNNDISGSLKDLGFSPEGTRVRTTYINGINYNEHVFSLTAAEYGELA